MNLTYVYKRKAVDFWGIQQLWKVAKPYVLNSEVTNNRIVRNKFLSQEDDEDYYFPLDKEQPRREQEDNTGEYDTTQYYGLQPYNNFHISRIDFWKSDKWKQFMNGMDKEHLFYKYRVGDANVHAMAIMMMGDQQSDEWYDIPYVHNSNDMGVDEWGRIEWKEECDEG
jgi:hypothetical protein